MTAPIELLFLSRGAPPDLSFSPFGPLVVHPAEDFAQLADALAHQAFDAVVIDCHNGTELSAVGQWSGLPMAVLDTAVLVLAPEPEAADALRLLRLGVQDVLPRREAGGLALARPLRLAVERKRLEREARKAFASDLATGLPNLSQLMEHMTHLLALREREPATMALLVLRIGGLEAATQRLGTESANVLRRKVAVRLRAGLRASDVVASLGSDTFAVLLARMDSPGDGPRVADKLASALHRPFSVTGQDVAVTVATGLALYPTQGKDAHSLLQRATTEAEGAAPRGRSGLGPRGGSAAANDD